MAPAGSEPASACWPVRQKPQASEQPACDETQSVPRPAPRRASGMKTASTASGAAEGAAR